ncbi:MAG: HlyC/CorC family transporter [Clostridia bacterium]|nr:HlyC/CorC family transporter [Clostridia bacterium]
MDDSSIWRCLSAQIGAAAENAQSGLNFGTIAVYLILIVLLILGGAYFAASETALSSVNKMRMKSYAEDGNKKAQYVMYILNNFDKALSTILIGNNVMHIACAAIATLLTRQLFMGSGFLDAALVLSTVLVTMVVFFAAEMLPKYRAKAASESVALRIGKSLYVLMKILTPVSAVFTRISTGIQKLFFKRSTSEPSVTEDDLTDLIESFKDEREEDEKTETETARLMVSALHFGARTARDSMTPWASVETLDTSMELADIFERVQKTNHSRFPMLNAKGRVVGVLNIRPFLKAYLRDGEETDLIDLIDTPLFIRPDVPVDELLSEMSHSKIHLAFVSEQGQVDGIITIEDILEELVGEIFDEYDPDEPQPKKGAESFKEELLKAGGTAL